MCRHLQLHILSSSSSSPISSQVTHNPISHETQFAYNEFSLPRCCKINTQTLTVRGRCFMYYFFIAHIYCHASFSLSLDFQRRFKNDDTDKKNIKIYRIACDAERSSCSVIIHSLIQIQIFSFNSSLRLFLFMIN